MLGIYTGIARIQVGGHEGPQINVGVGDVLLIPAGVAHKSSESSDDFKCVGAYPPGQHYDINYGEVEERPKADQNIRKVPLPKSDPVYGLKGGVTDHWTKRNPKRQKQKVRSS